MIRNLLAAISLGATITFLVGSAAATDLTLAASEPFDHLACYKVNDSKHFLAHVRLESLIEELDVPLGCKVIGRSRNFCAPVRKHVLGLRYAEDSNLSPLDMPGTHQREGRICYRIKCPVEPFVGPLTVEDQFGRRRLREFNLKRLCTNARVVHDDTTTTTTVSPNTTTTTLNEVDPCAVVDCAEGHFCRPTCEDPRRAECVPFAQEGEPCGGFVLRCMAEMCAPDLECLFSPVIPDAPGICVRRGEGECTSDADCPNGLVCVDSGLDLVPGGVCVPGCRNDDDCPEGQSCIPTPCPGPPCADQCVDVGDCRSDEDCDRGMVCEPGGPFDPARSACVPGCRTDQDCEPDHHCEEVTCVTTPCPPMCVADEPPGECGECASDADCLPLHFRCNAGDICLPSCECPECDVCAGHCVPNFCGDCHTDADCPEGKRCDAGCYPPCDCLACAVCAGKCVD